MSRQSPAPPEGALLQGKYELRRHLGSLPLDGELYLTFAGSATAPAPRLLLLRPAAAPADVREVGAASDLPGVPPVLDRFAGGGWQGDLLDTSANAPLPPPTSEANAMGLLVRLADLQERFAAAGFSATACTPAAVRDTRDGLVYCGPILAGAGQPDPLPLLDHLLQGGPFTREWRNAVAQWRQSPEAGPAALEEFRKERVAVQISYVCIGRGLQRDNEDACLVRQEFRVANGAWRQIDLLGVADGMGGHRAGTAAAAAALGGLEAGLAVEAVTPLLRAEPSIWGDNGRVVAALGEAVQAAHGAVQALAKNDERLAPGSTIAVALRVDRRLFVTHVGDSRVCLLRDGRLERLTRDHAAVDDRTAADGPRANALVHSLGHDIPAAEARLRWLRSGDRVVVCSDGVWAPLGERLAEVLAGPAANPANALVEAAVAAGSEDDLTAIVLIVE